MTARRALDATQVPIGALSISAALVVTASLAAPAPARAVPVFARRYGTSCQTCHVAFPKLTPFGAAFRSSGDRFPDGGDEDSRRSEPISLGADAYRDVFPDAVWPGDLPAEAPLSIMLASNALVVREPSTRLDLGGVGGSVTLNAAAPLGELASAWVGVSARGTTSGDAAVSIERAFVTLTPLRSPELLLRVGRFEPQIASFSSHRMLGTPPWILTRAVGDNAFALEPTQLGVEISGTGAGRVAYGLALVEGSGNAVDAPKDLYGRLGVKLGGMRLDGVVTEEEAEGGTPAPWREWSVQLGAFAYRGMAEIGDPSSASQDDAFVLFGGDVNAQLRDANLVVAYAYGENEQPELTRPGASVMHHDLMAQLDYVLFPWLIPLARYEWRREGDLRSARLSPGVYVLLRANVRAQVLAAIEKTGGSGYSLSQVLGGLAVGF